MRGGKGYLSLGLVVAGFLVASLAAQSFSSGIDRSAGFTDEEGCICHGPSGSNGQPNDNVHVLFRMDPSHLHYQPGQAYNITVGPAETDVPLGEENQNKGGFNLLVNVGVLEPGEGFEDFVTVLEATEGSEATHTLDGDKNGRMFNLTWTAPSGDEGPAVFRLFVNTVNGDAQNNEADHWNGRFIIVPGPDGQVAAGGAGVDPSQIGVRWLAHWVGLISFAAVVVTLVIYYFVLKYGESIHTTDHRDRQGK